MIKTIVEPPCHFPANKNIKTPREWQAVCIKLIPEKVRWEYTSLDLPNLYKAGAIKTSGDWRNYHESLLLIPEGDRVWFTGSALPALIGTGALKTNRNWIDFRECIKDIPEKQRKDYTQYVLPIQIKMDAGEELVKWKSHSSNARDCILEISERDSKWYFKSALPGLLHTGVLKTDEDWKEFIKSMKKVPENRRGWYTALAITNMAQKCDFSWLRVNEQLDIIQEYVERFGDNDFMWKTGCENFGKLNPINTRGRKLSFSKTGSELQVLDGRLSGRILRTINEHSYQAWVKATEAGIPCEEIFKYPDDHPKAGQNYAIPQRGGEIRVACLYGGPNLVEFFSDPANERYRKEVEQQAGTFGEQYMPVTPGEISKMLDQHGIKHNHLHAKNYVVQVVEGKPVVRVIDFDMAGYRKV